MNIHISVMKTSINFLKKVAKNNNSEWMQSHKEEYLAAKSEFEFLIQELITRISGWDSHLPFLEPKNCIFRLNRDVRFSDNKKPYKENFGAFFGYGGKKGGLPGYYFHISPKENFVAGGVWKPEAAELLKIRRFISDNGEDLRKILNDKNFKKQFGKLEDEQMLKRPPKGFSPADPFLELIKLKSFVVSKTISAEDLLKTNLGLRIDKDFRLMKSLNDFFMDALKT